MPPPSVRVARVLIIASELIEPVVRPLVHGGPYFEGLDARIDIVVARNEAFLGGDVVPGDLLVADDFTACIQRRAPSPDLVLIPSTPFGRWGRDISGKSYIETEREALHDDPVIEFFREQVLNLLDVVVLTCDGEPVRVNGFRLAQDEATHYDI